MTLLRTIDLRGARRSASELLSALPRPELDVEAAGAVVAPIIADVAERGLEAVLEATERIDGVRPEHVRVPRAALEQALAQLDPRIRSALETAIERVRAVDAAQRRQDGEGRTRRGRYHRFSSHRAG